MSYEMSDDESDDEVIPWTALASSQSKTAEIQEMSFGQGKTFFQATFVLCYTTAIEQCVLYVKQS